MKAKLLIGIATQYRVIIIMVFTLFSHQLIGQSNLAQIQGKLFNQQQEAAIFSTVSLYTADSTLIKGAVSNEEGLFRISKVEPGSYYLIIENIEYDRYQSETIELENGQDLTLEPIVLLYASKELSEVNIVETPQIFVVHPDKLVFNVAKSVNASGKNGLELLGKAPGVVVDPDNNVLLQGNGGVRIFINGRPSRLSGKDLATMLQSMQSDNIEAIEIITNPPARYEAEGNAGIINIQLKNNINLGYNGNIIHNFSIGKESRMNTGMTLNYGKGKWGITANLTRFDDIFAAAFNDNRTQQGYNINLVNNDRSSNRRFNFSTSITYNVNEQHSVNFSGGGILTAIDGRITANTGILPIGAPNNNQRLLSQTFTDQHSDNLNYNLNHQWKLSESASLNTDISYGNFIKAGRIYQPNTYFQADGITEIGEVNNGFDPDSDIDLYSVKTDFEKSFKKVALSAGLKYYQVKTANGFIVSNVVDGEFIRDDLRTNDFNYTEEVAAAYVSSNITLSKHLKATVGLRLESTFSEGVLESVVETENDRVKRQYTNMFPNIGLAYNKGKSSLNFGYGQRISRPNYQQLNPFEYKESELFVFKGNPFLNPNYVTNYSLTYVFDKALVLSSSYSITKDYFASITQINGQVASIIPQNMQDYTNFSISASYPLTIAKWWEASFYGNYSRRKYEGEFDAASIDLTADIYNVSSQHTFKLPLGLTVDLNVFYNGPWVWRGSIEVAETYGVDLGLKKLFFDDKLQVIVRGTDLFNGYTNYPYFGDYGGMTMRGVRSFDNQRVGFGLTYRFGNQKIKKQQREGGLSNELKRIE